MGADAARSPVTRLLVVQHQADAALGRLHRHLAPDADIEVLRPDLGAPLPDDLEGVAGLIVLGGSPAAWEDERAPWLPQTRALMARAVDEAVPLLGICLGAQLLALATGGRVERGAAGLEIGLSHIAPTDAAAGDALMAALPADGYPAPQGHQDAVTELPPGAVLLGTGELYRHQAFRVGETAWGLQYHPEVSVDAFAAWVDEEAAAVVAAGYDPAALVLQARRADALLEELAAAHATAFAGVARRAVPAAG